jgi:hypothetical protein
VGSDEEDYVLDNGVPSEEQVFGFGDAFVNANNDREGGVFVHRRRGGGKFFCFFFCSNLDAVYKSAQRTTAFKYLGDLETTTLHPRRQLTLCCSTTLYHVIIPLQTNPEPLDKYNEFPLMGQRNFSKQSMISLAGEPFNYSNNL